MKKDKLDKRAVFPLSLKMKAVLFSEPHILETLGMYQKFSLLHHYNTQSISSEAHILLY